MRKIGIFAGIFSVFCFILPAKSAELPLCNDARLQNVISEQIKNINEENVKKSPLNTRFSALFQKYLVSLQEIDVEKFDKKEDYSISDGIMELKVNKGYGVDDVRLCKSSYNGEENRVYAMIYADDDGEFNVEITAVIKGEKMINRNKVILEGK